MENREQSEEIASPVEAVVSCKYHKDRLVIYFLKLSIEIYWPRFIISNTDLAILLPTQLSVKRANKWCAWMLDWAFVLKIVGFGFGICWNHCENPNRVKDS